MHTRPERLYAQAKPDSKTIRKLQGVQASLPPQTDGRMIGADELHLTLIHFGKTDDVFERLNGVVKVDHAVYERELARYIAETSALLPNTPFELTFTGYELFGKNRTTLAAMFEPSEELNILHTKLFSLLLGFFERTGLDDPMDFIDNDGNFCHVGILRPHVTLYKGYSGKLPATKMDSVHFTPMKITY